VSARELITEHLDLWTGAVTKKSSSGRGSNSKVELTGIKKLRELILELALSGRLTEPEPNDESAHQLLFSIKAEKSGLVAMGGIKKPNKLTATDGSEPYPLPPHWYWVRLGEVTNYGTTDKAEPNQVADDTWVLELEDVEKESSTLLNKIRYAERQFKSSKNHFKRGDVLYGKLRPYLDKVLVADEPGVCTTEIIPIRGYVGILPEFLRLALKSPSFKRYANNSTHGMNLPRLGTDKARLAMIPLAPEQEQHRIVQKVDELMALCDRLEQQSSDQLEAHETLVDTLLGTLTQSESATELANNWARLATHFDTLFTTEQSIDKLKQTILQLAVMGRLVEQDAGYEPAKTLLVKLENKKLQLVKEGIVKKPKDLLAERKQEAPFNIPSNWEWVRLGQIVFIRGGKRVSNGYKLTKKETPYVYIRVSDFKDGSIDDSDLHYIDQTMRDKISQYIITSHDIYMTIVGATIGKCGLVPEKFNNMNLTENSARITPIIGATKLFIYKCLLSDFCQKQFSDKTNQVGVQKMALSRLGSSYIPFPPIEEQERIVQKIDELMALCDQLKEHLNEASATRCQLPRTIVEQVVH
jgi:type I restriction enzyme S subunit